MQQLGAIENMLMSDTPRILQGMKVTPETARFLLDHTNDVQFNRPIRRVRAETYAGFMDEQKWKYPNGDMIRISKSGRLLDGQHRLLATSISGKTITADFYVGLDDNAFNTIDRNEVRTMADLLHIAGYTEAPKTVAAAAQWVMPILEGRPFIKRSGRHYQSHPDKVIEFVAENPKLLEFIRLVRHQERAYSRLTSPSMIAAAWFILDEVNSEKADEFFRKLVSLEALTAKHPIKVLHDKLSDIKNTNVNSTTRHKIDQLDQFRYIIMAWNMFMRNMQVSKLQLPKNVDGKRVWPKIVTRFKKRFFEDNNIEAQTSNIYGLEDEDDPYSNVILEDTLV